MFWLFDAAAVSSWLDSSRLRDALDVDSIDGVEAVCCGIVTDAASPLHRMEMRTDDDNGKRQLKLIVGSCICEHFILRRYYCMWSWPECISHFSLCNSRPKRTFIGVEEYQFSAGFSLVSFLFICCVVSCDVYTAIYNIGPILLFQLQCEWWRLAILFSRIQIRPSAAFKDLQIFLQIFNSKTEWCLLRWLPRLKHGAPGMETILGKNCDFQTPKSNIVCPPSSYI